MISRLTANDLNNALDDLTEILHACVHDGASIGFIQPFPSDDAQRYWQSHVWPNIQTGAAEIFVYRDGERIVGTAQLVPAAMPNQAHRADVSKLLVHPRARRRGIGRALMATVEARARELGRSLLVLDTRSTDPSLLLYQSLGFEIAGEIPNYCRNPENDQLEPTTFMFKTLT
ncbi:GNAT family N-acetyltransferase [Ruegeria faecimaris]|uniref:GNAT family N-acetyltransferase n=1 Tax=Ruegeria faecimaris TaxID=686389 RepID=UPI00232F5E1A|nr:GNAT family N-acetyltransferase [Ruegeria faecimaris]